MRLSGRLVFFAIRTKNRFERRTAPEAIKETFKGVAGLTIFTRSWRPTSRPRGVVVIAHGFNSHSG